MKLPDDKRQFAAWLLLTAISLIYLWIDHSADHGGARVASSVITVAAICLALVKARITMREFMEVRRAPSLLCRLTDLWIALMAVALLGTYFAGKAAA